jgi:hypothetical protein
MIQACQHPDKMAFTGPEDIFFARHVKAASIPLALRFSIESITISDQAFGFHRPWEAVPTGTLAGILDVTPPPPAGASGFSKFEDVWLIDQWDQRLLINNPTKEHLLRWLRLGTNAAGFRVSRGARLPVPTVKQSVHLHFCLDGKEHVIPFHYVPSEDCMEVSIDVNILHCGKNKEDQLKHHEFSISCEVADVLEDILELGFVVVEKGVIVHAVEPHYNLYLGERWKPTLEYLREYGKHNPDFSGEFFVCIYDGWRELSPSVPHAARKYVTWSREKHCPHFLGKGVEGEPRFCHRHPDVSLYPVLPRPVLAYNRHIGDPNVWLIPDAEFLRNGFESFKKLVANVDVPWDQKCRRDKLLWRGSPNVSVPSYYNAHGLGNGPMHPRNLALLFSQQNLVPLDASFAQMSLKDMLQSTYLLDLDGMVSAWSGLYWKMLSGSLVFKLASHWEQWYYSRLYPFKHFIPIATLYEIPGMLEWCAYNERSCQDIADRATQFAKGLTYQYATQLYRFHK